MLFDDLTTVGIEGVMELPGEVREFGQSKDGGIARQFMLGVVQTAEGPAIAQREILEALGVELPTKDGLETAL